MWQGIKTLTGYKDTQTAADSTDSTLLDTLNQFFARFDQLSGEAHTYPALPERDDPVCIQLPCMYTGIQVDIVIVIVNRPILLVCLQ